MANAASIGIPELAALLADRHDLTKKKTKAILNDLRDSIVESILDGKRVALFGLGRFEIKTTKPRVGHNPRTGERISIPARRKVAFKAAKGVKDRL
uniref:Putative DNA-binding protein n=1 Tax=uncultured bacterium contig00001 TaxID=1181493 RepID=A0A806KF65_9BACT|nr:putative DNA-binding protein [uncultured bacterium contig00001]